VAFDASSTKDGLPLNNTGFILVSTSLAPGATVEEHFFVGPDSATWPVGAYSLRMKVDSDDVIAESNETNNLSPELVFTIVSGSSASSETPSSQIETSSTQIPGFELTLFFYLAVIVIALKLIENRRRKY
jgi:hypothetical protein